MEIKLVSLTKKFKRRGEVIPPLNLEIPNATVGLLGPNGAGKTTLMRLLCGIYRPTSGDILYNGKSLTLTSNLKEFRQHLGYLPQNITPGKNLSAAEYIQYMAYIKGHSEIANDKNQIEKLLEEVGLSEYSRQEARTLSGGMIRRLGIAQALIGDPRVIIVDEPTAGLDPEERLRFRMLLSRLGNNRLVILSTHILDDVAHTCEHVMFMKSGKILKSGKIDDVIAENNGKVWITPPIRSRDELGREWEIVGEEHGIEGIRFRVIGNNRREGFIPANPNLDDAYMAVVKGK